MSLHRSCCCEGTCGECDCANVGYSVTWTGQISFDDDDCGCRFPTTQTREGIRLKPFTFSDGQTRALSFNTSQPCTVSTGVFGGLGEEYTVAFSRFLTNNCVEADCPYFICSRVYAFDYELRKATYPTCVWQLRVRLDFLAKVFDYQQSGFIAAPITMIYEAPDTGSCVPPFNFEYQGTVYHDNSSASVGDCVYRLVAFSGNRYLAKVDGILPGTVTLSL